MPNWMTGDGGPGTVLNRGADGLPEINGVVQAPFACEIADSVWNGTEPAHAVMYGHGLLGSHLEVDAGNIVAMSNEHDALYCATKWAGFSEDDIPTAVAALQDFSTFPTFVDRMSQGLINQLVLGRLMLADNGLVIEPEFMRPDGSAMLDNSEVYFDGNSQGGIMGMALAAISTDLRRATLGCGRHELLDPAAPLRRLRRLRDDPRAGLPRPRRPCHRPRGHPDAVGSGRRRRLRPSRGVRSTAGHPTEGRPDARGVR